MKTNLKTRLHVEGLEDRRLMAGDLNAYVSGGTLFIRGDDAANGVSIVQQGLNRYSVTGFSTGTGNTLVNGQSAVRTFSGVTNDINVQLFGGDDAVIITQDDSLRQNFLGSVGGSSGPITTNPEAPNRAQTDPIRTTVPQNLFIDTGNGNDTVGANVRIGRDGHGGVGTIITGDGSDGVRVERSVVKSTLVINTGNQNDDVVLANVGIAGTLNTHMGAGNDLFRANRYVADTAVINTGADTDAGIRIANSHTDHDTVLLTESGNDAVVVSNYSAGGNMVVNTGTGNDTINGSQIRVKGDATLDSGSGSDRVALADLNVLDDVFIFLGSGNDVLRIQDSRADRVLLRGGADVDNFFNAGGNAFNSVDIAEFENL